MNPRPRPADQVLLAAGYVYDATHRVWSNPDADPGLFGYSDGDEVEHRIAGAIAKSEDLSVFSTELQRYQVDWPSIYHLSAARSNLLRSVSGLFRGARVLEIGAGCGAITRFLGEAGADVTALEGSARRASIASARCRDLENVSVLNERFDALRATDKFDVVTLVGVLEYSRMYTGGDDPVQETLRRALNLLSDDGVLLVAIENQLGLKYFAGVPEDHLGRSMAGIQDEYNEHSVVTFGKHELESRLRAAGFCNSEFALPFPDYKLPQNIILPAARATPFDAASLAAQAARADRQMTFMPLFSLGRAFGVVGRNDLLTDLANSFLVLAGKSSASASFSTLAPGVVAEQYSTERQPAFTKAARFVTRANGLMVERFRLCPDALATSTLLEHRVEDEPYLQGRRWNERLEEIMGRPGWRLDEVVLWFETWANALTSALSPTLPMVMETPVPVDWFDALPGNLIVGEDGSARFFDLEWSFKAPLTYGYLAFRALKLSLGAMTSVAPAEDQRMLQVSTLIRSVFRQHGLILTSPHVQTFLDMEAALTAEVRATIGTPLKVTDYNSEILATSPDVTALLTGRQEAFREFSKQNEELATLGARLDENLLASDIELNFEIKRLDEIVVRVEELDKFKVHFQKQKDTELARDNAIAEARRLDQRLMAKEAELDLIKESTSWSITSPLRTANAIVHRAKIGVRSRLGRAVRVLYRAIPVPPSGKRALKGALFNIAGPVFRGTGAYQRWRAYENTHAPGVAYTRGSDSPELTSYGPGVNVLWQSDGTREWQDYSIVHDRILKRTLDQQATKRPNPPSMLDFSAKPPHVAAAGVKLPEPPPAPDITILIPVYNQLTTTLECLASIAGARTEGDPSFEILIANDASTDDTSAVLQGIPHLRLIDQQENLGFLRNCNNASSHARGKYLLLLNNDVQVTSGWLSALFACMKQDPRIGAVGPRIIYPNGWLQEAGTRFHRDGSAELLGLNDQPDLPRYAFSRDVDYCSGACLLVSMDDFRRLGGFDIVYAPAYCEDSDLCMRLRSEDRRIVYCAEATVVHHLSRTSDALPSDYKLSCIARNLDTFASRWRPELDRLDDVRTIAFYLPQFHPIPENDLWWGQGFTEWTNVSKAKPNFVGHYQPRLPADLGYYDLRLPEIMQQQAELARRYGIGGFCYYYYWFAGHRLLERPIEQMLATGKPDFPFCLCWANENWTRRWDGQESEILMAQHHSDADDLAVIQDLIRFFRSPSYIRIGGKPLILVYRTPLFPNFLRTAEIWREVCRNEGIGEIYIAQVESFEMAASGVRPADMGCDASVEFPPQGMADPIEVTSPILNDAFQGAVSDYRDIAVTYATRDLPAYKRFMGVMPGWDNTARRQNNSYAFQNATPGAFQAWLETSIQRTKQQFSGDERLIFINAWNEWAEGAYLEPDQRFGHGFLEAHANARDADFLTRSNKYSLG